MIYVGVFSFSALLAIWGGYPLAVRVLAALRRRRATTDFGNFRTVTVAIASSDDAATIRSRVTDVLAGDYPSELLEVVVALDCKRAKATQRELSDLDPRVVVVIGDMPGGKAATLNAAVRHARHEVLVMTDTAQRFEPDAIPRLIESLGRPGVGAVSGMLNLPGANGSLNLAERYWRYERWLRLWEARLHSSVGVTGAIYAMPRALWKPLPAGLILDDVYVPMRLVLEGWRVDFNHLAQAQDVRRFEAGQEYHRKVRTLTGVIQVSAWLPGILNPLRNPIWLQFVFHKLLRLVTPYLAALVGISGVWILIAALLGVPHGREFLFASVVFFVILGLIPHVRRILRARLAWGMAMQSSILVATVNGLRGRWDVWS